MGAGAAGADKQAGASSIVSGIQVASQVAGGVMSLVQADKQAAAKQEADKAAAAAAEEAKRQLSQNFFQGLQLPMDTYDRAMREATAQQMQALSALQETDPRALAGGVGRLQLAGNDYLAKEREALANRLFELDKLKAGASADIAQNLGEFEMQRAKGAQMASMAANEANVNAMNAGLGQFANAAVGLERVLNPTYARTLEIEQKQPVQTVDLTPRAPQGAVQGVNSALAGQLAALNYGMNPMTGYNPNQTVNPFALGWQGAPYLLPNN